MKKLLILLSLCLVYLEASAQKTGQQDIDIQASIDDLMSAQDGETFDEALYENYLELLNNPLDLNTATEAQVRSLLFLSETQIKALLRHRQEQGALLSIYELQAIPSFDPITIQRLLPFISLSDPSQQIDRALFKRMLNNDNNYLIARVTRIIETREGFLTTDSSRRFMGDPQQYYLRFRSSRANDFSIGFTAEQDAGEAFAWKPDKQYYGVDFFSFHAQVQNKGRLKQLILGDYLLQAGQGLVLGGAFGTGKGGETINSLRRSQLGAIPYTSSVEHAYLRGLSATYALSKNFQLSPFFSYTHRDARLETDSLEMVLATSRPISGLHRNMTEMSTRKQLGESQYGIIGHYEGQQIQGGIIYQQMHFSQAIRGTQNLYQPFYFQGREATNYSAYANYTLYNFSFFSEFAKNHRGGYGYVAGMLGSLSPAFDVALLYRHYTTDFVTITSNAFSESTRPQNESGMYWGFKYKMNHTLQVSAYVDLFTFPWMRYRSYNPSTGHEYLLNILYQPNKTQSYTLQVREEVKERNLGIDHPFYLTGLGKKHSLLLNANYTLAPGLRLRSRWQWSRYALAQTSMGMALMQDISYDIGKLRISGRVAIFDTDDFDNRQYVNEQEVWLAYSLQAYTGQGMRRYLMLQYDVNKKLSCWMRYGHMHMMNSEFMGSGLDRTAGNRQQEIRLQIRLSL